MVQVSVSADTVSPVPTPAASSAALGLRRLASQAGQDERPGGEAHLALERPAGAALDDLAAG